MPKNQNKTDMSFENSIEITEVLLAHKSTFRSGETCTVYSEGRNFCGFVCPLQGTAIYRNSEGEEMFDVGVGEIVYLPEMSRYIVEGGEKGFTHYTVNFLLHADCDNITMNFAPLFGDEPVKIAVEDFDSFKLLFLKAVSAFGTNMFGATLLVKSQVYEMIHQFFSDAIRSKGINGEYDVLVKAKHYIEEHFCENIKVRDLSHMCSMSETNLRRKFREYIGQPPLDYQIGLRIRRARELLLERKYNVSEVALLVGIDDVNYFSRLFKKRVGVSPQVFEKMY